MLRLILFTQTLHNSVQEGLQELFAQLTIFFSQLYQVVVQNLLSLLLGGTLGNNSLLSRVPCAYETKVSLSRWCQLAEIDELFLEHSIQRHCKVLISDGEA